MAGRPWFIAAPGSFTGGRVELSEGESHHALKVLRVAPPDVIVVTDGAGRVANCAVASTDSGVVIAEILDEETRRAPRPAIAVYQGAAKGRKVDETFERLAELGIAEARCFSSERSVARWDEAKGARLAERWASIARGAAKQSRNPHVMATGTPLGWDELLDAVKEEPAAVILWEGASLPLRTALAAPMERIALVIGPEGGFTRAEAEALADAGGQLVSLGPQILRTENAAFAAASAVLFHFGLIG